MKTLDEVIKKIEATWICPSSDEANEYCEMMEVREDALHYLKAYKNTDENYRKAITHVNKIIDHYEKMVADYLSTNNPALTWDELKQMEGKPVWVEVDGNWWGRFWAFVETANENYMNFFQKGQEYPEDLWKRELGKTWQAYRKEK